LVVAAAVVVLPVAVLLVVGKAAAVEQCSKLQLLFLQAHHTLLQSVQGVLLVQEELALMGTELLVGLGETHR
jgi:hypothetical protein